MTTQEITLTEDEATIHYEEDVYSEDSLDEMCDDDTISAGEHAFMVGYLREEELEE